MKGFIFCEQGGSTTFYQSRSRSESCAVSQKLKVSSTKLVRRRTSHRTDCERPRGGGSERVEPNRDNGSSLDEFGIPSPRGFREGSIRVFENLRIPILGKARGNTRTEELYPDVDTEYSQLMRWEAGRKGGWIWSSAVQDDRSVFGRREKTQARPGSTNSWSKLVLFTQTL